MPITANGTGGSRPTSAASRHASASAVSSRPVDLERREAEQVARRDPQQLAPLEPAQALLRVLRCSPRHSSVSSASSTSSARVFSAEHQVVVAERVDELRVAAQRVADHAARPEERARALGGAGESRNVVREDGRTRRALGQAAQLQQPEVGVGRARRATRGSRAAAAASASGGG